MGHFSVEITPLPGQLSVEINNLTLTGGLAYIHGRYGDFPVSKTVAVPTGGVALVGNVSAEGQRLQSTPEWQYNLGASYRVPLKSGQLNFQVNHFYSGRWYAVPDNRLYQPAYSLTNASVTWSLGQGDKYRIQLWGKNLGNQVYAQQFVTQLPFSDFVAFAPGRTFGVTASADF